MIKVGSTDAMSDKQYKIHDFVQHVAHPLGISELMGSSLDPNRVKTLTVDPLLL